MLVDCGRRAAGQAGSAQTGPRREGSGGCGALRLQCCSRAPGGSGGAGRSSGALRPPLGRALGRGKEEGSLGGHLCTPSRKTTAADFVSFNEPKLCVNSL